MTVVLVKEIRKVSNGYIVEVRWPYGNEPCGYGEVICPTIEDVIALIRKVNPTES